ncbi:hypothetical protein KAS08_04310 [Candidatus Pacearchaeota archaeon]|nr:hypothetical protein [Candidatus Pacearchaeota archaeon]
MKIQLIFIILALSMTSIIADNPLSISLIEGKNNFTISEYFPSIYASELMEKYPQVQSVSVVEYGSTFGYINALGGIGTNILIESNKDYEIYTNQSIIIYLKN